MRSPEATVREFCQTIATKDLAKLRPFLAEDAIYHNIPLEPAVGVEAVLRSLAEQFGMFERIDFQIRNIAAAGGIVLTEGLDVVHTGQAEAAIPVMGTFEVRGDQIVAWRDYFDVAQTLKLLGGSQTATTA